MIPKISFPAHTQARMAAAANAAKELKQPKKPEVEQPAVAPPTLPGEVMGLSVDARQKILKCSARVIIGYGTLEVFTPLVKGVNLAMLRHYAPHIVANYKHTTAIGHIIILPDDMTLVTERGVRYVITNMKREIEWGSYATSHFFKDDCDLTCMVRPCHNPVDMIHGLNTLRAFGLTGNDTEFLTTAYGPISTGLERRAIEWTGNLWSLKRFLNTLASELLVDEDSYLLDRAWAVYLNRLEAQPRSKTSGRKTSGN